MSTTWSLIGENDMINIRCKKCGWKLPFSSRGAKDSVQNRGGSNVNCPNCGELLIQKGGKKNHWY